MDTKLKIIVANNIRVQNPDEKIKNYVEKNLVIDNPDYIRNERLGYSNYKTPKYLVYYEIKENEIILPFGCLADLFKMYSLEKFENRIVLGKHQQYKSNIKLFDYQEEVCKKAINQKNGIIVMPARVTGKLKQHLKLLRD